MVKKEETQFRPYAAPANVIALINRARTRNLPEIINNDFLRITGVPEAVWYRVMQAVQFLGLVHEDGRPSDTFEALAGAPDNQYRELLGNIIREAYRTEFNVVDPGQDSQPRIIDAFRPYKPRSQTQRMVMLFLGLCREAGIPVLDVPRERRMRETQLRRYKTTAGRNATGPTIGRTTRQAVDIPTRQTSAGLLFGVTEDDINALSQDEFEEVWSALGKVARARARARERFGEEETSKPRTDKEEEKEIEKE